MNPNNVQQGVCVFNDPKQHPAHIYCGNEPITHYKVVSDIGDSCIWSDKGDAVTMMETENESLDDGDLLTIEEIQMTPREFIALDEFGGF